MALSTDPFLLEAAIYLGAAVVAVPLFRRLGLGSVVGYLVAGAVIGPWGIGLIDNAESALHFAEYGVVLLLFVIGLELQPSRLWRLRTEIFGLGALQVLLTGAVLAAVIGWQGWLPGNAAIAVGGALALSSTAFAVQILRERGDLTRPYGDRAFSILLFQDLSIVPLLALVSILSPWGGQSGADVGLLERAGLAVGAIGALVLAGRFLLRPLFRVIATTRSDEIFTAAALLVVVGAAIAMQVAGLSMALGAFLAGVLLAESEFRHQLESDIEPFRGLLLGLLFIAVGMSVAWPLVAQYWPAVIFGALALFALKAALIFALCRLFRSSVADALRIGVVLGQGGEFGFVLFTVAIGEGVLTQRDAFVLTAMVTLSMALTPVALSLVDHVLSRRAAPDMNDIEDLGSTSPRSVIIVGFGRFGQVVSIILRLRGYEVTLVDSNPERIRFARSLGEKVYFGDIRRPEVLRIAGADRARAIFLCADDPQAVRNAVRALRERLPNLTIFARAPDRVAELELLKEGADVIVRDVIESSVLMARLALTEFGDTDAADEVIGEFRRRDAELLRLQAEFGALDGLHRMHEKYDLKKP